MHQGDLGATPRPASSPARLSTEELIGALGALEQAVERVEQGLEQVACANPIDPAILTELVEQACQASFQLSQGLARTAATLGQTVPPWPDRAALRAGVERLVEECSSVAQRCRSRLYELAPVLAGGSLFHRSAGRRQALSALRDAAVDELQQAARSGQPPELPGPEDARTWLPTVLHLSAEDYEPLSQKLAQTLPRLLDLVEQLEISNWCEGPDQPAKTSPSPGEPLVSGVAGSVGLEAPPSQGQELDASRGQLAEGGQAEPVEAHESPALVETDPAAEPERATLQDPIEQAPPSLYEALPADPPAETIAQEVPVVAPVDEETPAPAPGEATPSADGEAPEEAPLAPPDAATTAVSAVTPAPLPPPAVPASLANFETFSRGWWIDPATSSCRVAPWTDTNVFPMQLATACEQAFAAGQLGRLFLYCRAQHELGLPPSYFPADIASVAELRSRPNNPLAGRLAERSSALHGLAAVEVDSPSLRLRLFLEALRPAGPLPWAETDSPELVNLAAFEDLRLDALVRELLQTHARWFGMTPPLCEVVREAEPPNPAKLKEQLQQLRQEFHKEYVRVCNACGGRIQRTHCRRAFDEFITGIAEEAGTLFPEERGGLETWDVKSLGDRIALWSKEHADIADRAGARFQDRVIMDRVVAGLEERASHINLLQQQLAEALEPGTSPRRRFVSLAKALEACLTGPPSARVEEEQCRELVRLLTRPLTKSSTTSEEAAPLALSTHEGFAAPDLLALAPELDLGPLEYPAARPRAWLTAQALQQPLLAATLLLQSTSPELPGNTRDTGRAFLLHRLADQARPELLSRIPALQQRRDHQRLHAERSDAQQRVLDLARELRIHWSQLDEAAWTGAAGLLAAIQQAEQLNERLDERVDLALLAGWLQELSGAAAGWIEGAAAGLLGRARGLGPDAREALHAAVRDHRFGDALRLLDGGAAAGSAAKVKVRETAFRNVAAQRFPRPRDVVERLQDGEGKPALPTWVRGVESRYGLQTAQKILTEFTAFFFPGGLFRDERQQNRVSLLIPELIRWLERRNPTFLPQVAGLNRLVLIVPKSSVAEQGFETACLTELRDHAEGDLVVFLVPRLTAEKRIRLIRKIGAQSVQAAVLDDLDLCRLAEPDGDRPDAVLGLLELAFEQGSRRHLSPYSTGDGQHVRMEMFVGRSHEANRLALSSDVSRLFSGRQLGKSALLKYVQARYDGQSLPSGARLRVVYVPLVGASDEDVVVNHILDQLGERTGFACPDLQRVDACERLAQAAKRFLEQRPDESLLLVLDEADVFVESQLAAYEQKHEKCLSFIMRTRIMAPVDGRGLPRVRFVFSGYRATHTTGGAWANWGEVLRLAPLEQDEAAALVEGPLARLGVDAGAHARAIAFRCGYQPAVLLACGKELLERLDRTVSRDETSVTLTPAFVAESLSEGKIQEAIRTIVMNNFQGNPVGKILFRALLLEFADAPPGEGLDDLADRIRQRLEGLIGIGWLAEEAGLVLAEIERHLDDFQQRQLLVRRGRRGQSAYSLRFPHHLPILLQKDQEADLKDDFRAYMQQRNGKQEVNAGIHGLLPQSVAHSLALIIGEPPDPDFPIAGAVVAGHWPEALTDPAGGLPQRFGIPAADVLAHRQALRSRHLEAPRCAVHGIVPAELDNLRERRAQEKPPLLLLGGADLLRHVLDPAKSGGQLWEIAGLGRIPRRLIHWWFSTVRGLEFEDVGAEEQIVTATAGIPLLLRSLDGLFVPKGSRGGVNIDPARFASVLEELEQRLPELATTLVSGRTAFRREPRELQLLRMVAHVSQQRDQADLPVAADLTEEWEVYYRESCPCEGLRPGEHWQLGLLLELGLLPSDPARPRTDYLSRAMTLAASDPLHKLLAALPENRA